MSKRNKQPLGRGLNSLLGGADDTSTGLVTQLEHDGALSIASLPLALIDTNPDQPRRQFDEERLEELATSIKHLGLIQPITVQPRLGGRYMLISGERRYRAARMAGLDSLPVYIRQGYGEQVLEMALVENIQREDLNAIEIALAYQQLAETHNLTHEQLAERVGKKRATVSNYLRLLRLPAQIQLGLSERLLEIGHAKALLQIDDPERQMELYQLTVQESLSVRDVEELARAIKEGGVREQEVSSVPSSTTPPRLRQPEEYRVLEKHLGQVFGTKVALKCNPQGKGRISIPFAGEEELERIILLLERIQQR